MNKWGALAAITVTGLLATGCASDDNNDGLPKASKLAADSGKRYKELRVPTMEGLTCDKGRAFRFGNDLDLMVAGDDDLKEIKDTGEDAVSCFGPNRITLSKGRMQATVPDLTTRTTLYEKVDDPTAALDKAFSHSMDLAKGYGRTMVGKPETLTTKDLVMRCQQNVTDTFPMTSCYWANYGAIGLVDFFPPDGKHVPVKKAAAQTYKFAMGTLASTDASS